MLQHDKASATAMTLASMLCSIFFWVSDVKGFLPKPEPEVAIAITAGLAYLLGLLLPEDLVSRHQKKGKAPLPLPPK